MITRNVWIKLRNPEKGSILCDDTEYYTEDGMRCKVLRLTSVTLLGKQAITHLARVEVVLANGNPGPEMDVATPYDNLRLAPDAWGKDGFPVYVGMRVYDPSQAQSVQVLAVVAQEEGKSLRLRLCRDPLKMYEVPLEQATRLLPLPTEQQESTPETETSMVDLFAYLSRKGKLKWTSGKLPRGAMPVPAEDKQVAALAAIPETRTKSGKKPPALAVPWEVIEKKFLAVGYEIELFGNVFNPNLVHLKVRQAGNQLHSFSLIETARHLTDEARQIYSEVRGMLVDGRKLV